MQTIETTTRRLKTFAALIGIVCVLGLTLGTIVSMIRSFNAIAAGGQPVDVSELAIEMERSFSLGVVLVPVALIAAIVWIICWFRLRRRFVFGRHRLESTIKD